MPDASKSNFRVTELVRLYSVSIDHEDLYSDQGATSFDSGILTVLREIAASLLQTDPGPQRVIASRTILATLLALANDKVNSVDYREVEPSWLRLYADASFLISAGDYVFEAHSPDQPESFWTHSVRRLDLAIIVAGAVDERRLELIGNLIEEIQARYLPRQARIKVTDEVRSAAEIASSTQIEDTLLSHFAQAGVVNIPRAPSVVEYRMKYAMKPFIIRNFFNATMEVPGSPWPALQLWHSAEYLLDMVGEGRVVPVETGKAYVDADWGQQIIPFRTFLSSIGFSISPQADSFAEGSSFAQPLYLAQHSLFMQFPQLKKDFPLPDYVWSSPAHPDTAAVRYIAMPEPIVNAWIGRNGSDVVSPAHTDPHYNCYAQVLGSKRVWLAPPEISPFMYAHGTSDHDNDGSQSLADTYMTNTSRVPILRHGIDLPEIQEKFPRFFDTVFPQAQEAVLHPGDLLSMPPGWWHAMRGEGEGPGWSVSMWF